jgi:hypothetical protein
VDIGVGIEAAHYLEYFFSAAHAGQPVVDERDFHTAATASGAPIRL